MKIVVIEFDYRYNEIKVTLFYSLHRSTILMRVVTIMMKNMTIFLLYLDLLNRLIYTVYSTVDIYFIFISTIFS